jgi:hypothetical protein
MVGMGVKRMTAKAKALLAAYGGEARLNLTEAARIAGYSSPATQGWSLRRKWPEEFARVEDEFRRRLAISDEELDEIISSLARNPKHKDHFKAVELVCRLKGKLSEKVHITLDRPTLNRQLDELVALMVSSRAATVEVNQIAAGDALPPTALPKPADN